MALQIRRAHRFFSSPQDLIALRTSNHANRGKVPGTFPRLRPLSLSAILATTFLVSGCAQITHQPVKYHAYPFGGGSQAERQNIELANQKEDLKQTGVRYYLSSPYLLVYNNGKGKLVWDIVHLPDQTKLMVATPTQIMAKATTKLTFANGVLTESESELDSSAIPKAVIEAVEKVLPLLMGAFVRTTVPGVGEIPAPQLYKIVIDGNDMQLVGIQNSETVKVSLKPGS